MRRFLPVALGAALLLAPRGASAHFLWLTVEPAKAPGGGATVRAFLNEDPEPGGPEFLEVIRGVRPTVAGCPLASAEGERTIDAPWAGALPAAVDAERDLGVKSRNGAVYRLYYTARAQASPVAIDSKETADKLRARLVTRDGKPMVQVLFDGAPVARARIKVYPEGGEPAEKTTDEAGLASIDGLSEGRAALWANWVEARPGTAEGKAYTETRYYATLTVVPRPTSASPGTTFATMPPPAVNSFGAAVLGDWLYSYSGHAGVTHEYSVDTTVRHFRRLNLDDRSTWEELPMGPDVQGSALVSDGRSLYRLGGMAAKNGPDDPHDLYSTASFARFDPESKTWTELAPMPRPRSTHDAVVIGRKVYAVGGWTMKGAEAKAEFLDDAVVFDLDHPEAGWTSFPQPFRRRALAAAEAGGKLYVLGGLNAGAKIERRVDVYDPATRTWSTAPELPGPGNREGFAASAFAVDGRIHYSGLAGVIYRLDPADGWQAVGAWSQPRNTHRLLAGPGHSLLAVGGNYKGKQTPVIESVTISPPTRPEVKGE